MQKYQFSNIRILLVDPNPQFRQSLKGALWDFGFSNIHMTGNLQQVEDTIESDLADVMVVNTNFDDGIMCDIIQDLRHSVIGTNPFPVTVGISNDTDPNHIRRIINAGYDDILIPPITAQEIFNRIVHKIEFRKPFVVTHDYLGPDRRKKDRQGPNTEVVPLTDVPNPLRLRALGLSDLSKLQQEINETRDRLNFLKIERHGYQIKWLAERVKPNIFDENYDDQYMNYLTSIADTAKQLIQRLPAEKEDVNKVAALIIPVVQNLLDAGDHPSGGDLKQLGLIADDIAKATAALHPAQETNSDSMPDNVVEMNTVAATA